jgi:hypothetical protein
MLRIALQPLLFELSMHLCICSHCNIHYYVANVYVYILLLCYDMHMYCYRQVVRATIYDETGYWYPTLSLVRSLHARVTAVALVSVANCKLALLYCSCLAVIAFIFLSELIPVATLLLFPIQAFVALRFSQVID